MRFNTKKVRLKHLQVRPAAPRRALFQYQKGAIKTVHQGIGCSPYQRRFNTKKVRLKPPPRSRPHGWRRPSFNTKKVRLKLVSGQGSLYWYYRFNTKKVRLKPPWPFKEQNRLLEGIISD